MANPDSGDQQAEFQDYGDYFRQSLHEAGHEEQSEIPPQQEAVTLQAIRGRATSSVRAGLLKKSFLSNASIGSCPPTLLRPSGGRIDIKNSKATLGAIIEETMVERSIFWTPPEAITIENRVKISKGKAKGLFGPKFVSPKGQSEEDPRGKSKSKLVQ